MNSHTYNQKPTGFTLVEVLVYLAILVLVSTAAVSVMVSFSGVVSEQRTKARLITTGQTTLERVLRTVKNADAIDALNSTFGVSPGALTVLATDGSSKTFSLVGSVVQFTETGSPSVALTGDGVHVSNLQFHFYDNGVTELVRMAITMTATSSEQVHTETFYGAMVIRGSYD